MAFSTHSKSFCRLLQAARGATSPVSSKPLRCFPLESHHIDNLPATPQDFHFKLCNMIRNARHRVYLASLYVGTGANGRQEQEFLDALASLGPKVQVKILLDENRATRLVKSSDCTSTSKKTNSSAEAVHQCLQQHQECPDSGLYLFPTLPEPRRSLLPSPLNEIAGVFHCKVYIVDDELILSGANLSQEYFTDRQDRYISFTNGGGGLIDFYVNLMDVLCEYGDLYKSDKSTVKRRRKQELIESLSKLMDGSKDVDPTDEDGNIGDFKNIVAYAVPTFQAPEGFFPTNLEFPMDAQLTRSLLAMALSLDKFTQIQLASAYLNPKPQFASTLSKFENLQLLTAGYKSHGFSPKPGQPRRRGDWVPSIFSALYAELEVRLPHAEFLYYERPGWTFHAKGLWVSQRDGTLAAAVLGSGNYGARSEVMDVESNTILVFCHAESELQSRLQSEWKSMCRYAHEGHAIEFPKTSWRVKAALPFIRDLF